MVLSPISRPFTCLSGAPLRNRPFRAHYREIRKAQGVETVLAEGEVFRDSVGRLRTDIRTSSSTVPLNLTRIVDPLSSNVTVADHDARTFYTMSTGFCPDRDRYWVSNLTSTRIPDDRLEICSSRRTIEGLECFLLVVDSRLSYEVWVSHLLGFAVREQIRDEQGLRIWSMSSVRIGEVAEEEFQISQNYLPTD